MGREGPTTEGNETAGTFKVSAREWEGAMLVNGQLLSVEILANAELMDDDNNVITKAALFTQIGTGARVDVRGSIQSGVLKADRVRLDNQ
jgi:hypothetical protein